MDEIIIKQRYSMKEILEHATFNYLKNELSEKIKLSARKLFIFITTKKTHKEIIEFCKYFAKDMYEANIKASIPKDAKAKQVAKILLHKMLIDRETRKQLARLSIVAFDLSKLRESLSLNEVLFEMQKHGFILTILNEKTVGLQVDVEKIKRKVKSKSEGGT